MDVNDSKEKADNEHSDVEVTNAKADEQKATATIANDSEETVDDEIAVEATRIDDASSEIVNDTSVDDTTADKAAEATGDDLMVVVESPTATTKSNNEAAADKESQRQVALDSPTNSTHDSSNLNGEIATAASATETVAPTAEVSSEDVVLESVNEPAVSSMDVNDSKEKADNEHSDVEVTNAKADEQKATATIANDSEETVDDEIAVEATRIDDASSEIVNDTSVDDTTADKAAEATGDDLMVVVESPTATSKSNNEATTNKEGQHQEETVDEKIAVETTRDAASNFDEQEATPTNTIVNEKTVNESAEATPANTSDNEKTVSDSAVAPAGDTATKTDERLIPADDMKSAIENCAQEDSNHTTTETTGVLSDVKDTVIQTSGNLPDSHDRDGSVRRASSTIKSEALSPNTSKSVQFSAKNKDITADTTNTPQQTKVAASPKSPFFQSLRSKWEDAASGSQQDTTWTSPKPPKAPQLFVVQGAVTTPGKDSNEALDYTQQQLKQARDQLETEKLTHEAEKARLEKRTKELETQMNALRSSLVGTKEQLLESEEKRLESEESRADLIEKVAQQEAEILAAPVAEEPSPRGSASQSSTAQMSRAATASQQQTLMEESGKMLEFLRKEVLRLRAENSALRGDLDVVSASTQRLLEANAAAESSFVTLNEKAKKQRRKSDAENSDYAIQIQELKMVQENMRDEVRMKQAAYIEEVRSRLQYQESMGKVVDLLQQRCRDSRLVEDVLQITDEAEHHEDDAPPKPSPATPDSSLNDSMVGRFTSLFS